MRSREFALFVSLVLLPFLLASATAHALPVLALGGLMLLPPALGWFVASRGFPAEARIVEMLAALAFVFAGFLAGFGGGLSLALVLLVIADPLLFLSMPAWTLRRSLVAAALLFCAAVIVAVASSEARLLAFFAPACLAFPPALIKLVKQLGRHVADQPASAAKKPSHHLDDALLAASREAALLLDRGGRVMAVSANVCEILQLGAVDLEGRGLFERLHLLDRPTLLKACIDTRAGVNLGIAIPLRLRLDPVRQDARVAGYGDFEARFVTTADPEGIAVLLSRSKSLLGSAPALARWTSEPSANVLPERIVRLSELSHHLRTPLNAVLGFANLLANPTTQPRSPGTIAEYGEMIHASGEHLSKVVDLLIDMLRLQSGDVVLNPEPLTPVEIVDAVRREIMLEAGEFAASIEFTGPDVPVKWLADRKVATQLLHAAANALLHLQPAKVLRIRASAGESDILFGLSGAWLRDERAPPAGSERDLLKDLPQAVGLAYDLARSLASYQSGSLEIEKGADGNIHAAMRLPLAIKGATAGTEPVRLDDFRRHEDKMTSKMRGTRVKKHA